MAFLYCARVFIGLSLCCYETSRPKYKRLLLWQRVLDEMFTLHLDISQIISPHTATSPNLVSPCADASSRSIRLMKRLVPVFQDPHDFIWAMIITMQKWFITIILVIQDLQQLVVRRGMVMHYRDHDLTHLRSDFSKRSVLLHLLTLWYIDETMNKIAHKGNPKFHYWHHS
jgi:hypothetical protein